MSNTNTSAHSKSGRANVNLGISFMLIHALALSFLYVVVKSLTSVISSSQVTFLYKIGVFVIMLPWCLKNGIMDTIRTKKLHLHIARGAVSLAGTTFFHKAISSISILDATAMTYLEQVIILLIGVFYFKESLTSAKIVMTICGLAGVMIISTPSMHSNHMMGYANITIALVFWAMNNMIIKILGKTERTQTQLFYSSLVGSILALPMVYNKSWGALNASHIKYILSLAILHGIHVIAFFRAFKLTEISTVIPFDYSRLVFGGILGYVFFSEYPATNSIVGYFLIAGGGIYMIFSKDKKKNAVIKIKKES